MIIHKNIGFIVRGLSTAWMADKFLFLGYYSEISNGRMPNRYGTDYLDVSGSAGSETYQCPNTQAYIDADADYIWFKTDEEHRTVTTEELLSYDFTRTLIGYDDDTPNQLRIIGILKEDTVLTEEERESVFYTFSLPTFWDDSLAEYSKIKNKEMIGLGIGIGMQTWTPELTGDQATQDLVARMAVAPSQALYDLINTTIVGLKADGVWSKADAIYIRALHTEQAALLNWVANEHNATKVSTPEFVEKLGFRSNGSSTALNLNMNLNTKSNPKMGLENATVYILLNEISETSGRYPFGGATSGVASLRCNHVSLPSSGRMYLNSGVYSGVAVLAGTAFGMTRTGTTDTAYSGGTKGASATHASMTEFPAYMGELCYYNASSPTSHYPGLISASFYGSYLTETEWIALNNRITYFMSNVASTF